MNLSTLAPYIDKNLDLQTIKQNLNLYTTILLEWNQTHNLTGAQSAQDIQKNIIDSLYPLCFCEILSYALMSEVGLDFLRLRLLSLNQSKNLSLASHAPKEQRFCYLSSKNSNSTISTSKKNPSKKYTQKLISSLQEQ